MADRQVQGPQRGEDLRVPDDVALDIAGDDEGQAAVDREADVTSPGAARATPARPAPAVRRPPGPPGTRRSRGPSTAWRALRPPPAPTVPCGAPAPGHQRGLAPHHRHPVGQVLGLDEVQGVEQGAGASVVQLPGRGGRPDRRAGPAPPLPNACGSGGHTGSPREKSPKPSRFGVPPWCPGRTAEPNRGRRSARPTPACSPNSLSSTPSLPGATRRPKAVLAWRGTREGTAPAAARGIATWLTSGARSGRRRGFAARGRLSRGPRSPAGASEAWCVFAG